MPHQTDQVTTRTTVEFLEVGRGRRRQRLDLTPNPEPFVNLNTLRKLGVKIVERQVNSDARVVPYDFGSRAGRW